MPENHDEDEAVQAALARDTQDGAGDLDNLPESDLTDQEAAPGGGVPAGDQEDS